MPEHFHETVVAHVHHDGKGIGFVTAAIVGHGGIIVQEMFFVKKHGYWLTSRHFAGNLTVQCQATPRDGARFVRGDRSPPPSGHLKLCAVSTPR